MGKAPGIQNIHQDLDKDYIEVLEETIEEQRVHIQCSFQGRNDRACSDLYIA
jgi:hypothetical protein